MYTIDLSGNVLLYAQEKDNYCGPASVQMTRMGYPNPADRQWFSQDDLWTGIRYGNSQLPADVNSTPNKWDSDPQGLWTCLQEDLGNPADVNWEVHTNSDPNCLLWNMLFWMKVRQYPSPILIAGGEHWVVVVGAEMDVEPNVGGQSPTLSTISWYDPYPVNIGMRMTKIPANLWFEGVDQSFLPVSLVGPWFGGSVHYTGTWYGNYVAMIEPPTQKGRVRVKEVKRIGDKLLTSAQAVKHAKQLITGMNLANQNGYNLLGHKDVDNLEPMLVREGIRGGQEERVPHYYIVPFGFKNEYGERNERMARVCILVNAYTGKFEGMAAFGKPIRYLPGKEVLEIVATAMRRKREGLHNVDLTLTFQPSGMTYARAWPFWQVRIDERTMYVDQLGKIHVALLPSTAGN